MIERMELEITNKLFLELSQFTTAMTKKELEYKEIIRELHNTIKNEYPVDLENKVKGILRLQLRCGSQI